MPYESFGNSERGLPSEEDIVERNDSELEAVNAKRDSLGIKGLLEEINGEVNSKLDNITKRLGVRREKKLSRSGRADCQGSPKYIKARKDLEYRQKEQEATASEIGILREEILQRADLPLSEIDFNKYFGPAILKQGNMRDNDVIAAIHALSCSPHFELFCRSSMERLPDGSWRVKIPFIDGGKENETINIRQKDISPVYNLKAVLTGETDVTAWTEKRLRLKPIEANEGYKVLEAVFLRGKSGDHTNFDAEQRRRAENTRRVNGGESLLAFGGDIFNKIDINSLFLGGILHPEDTALLDHLLENFNPEIHIATARSVDEKTASLKRNHYYSIANIDREKDAVRLYDPDDTSLPIEISFEQFKNYFSGFEAVEIDGDKLLKKMKENLG